MKKLTPLGSMLPSSTTFKPIVIPRDFVLLIDSREQAPLYLEHRLPAGEHATLPKFVTVAGTGLEVIVKKVEHGDYSILGLEDYVAIERKQASDFYGYVGKERHRTEKKLHAMQHLRFKALVIEGRPADILYPEGDQYTTLTKEHIDGFLRMVRVRHNVHVYIGSKAECERFVLGHLVYAWKEMRKV
jgi:ERCC4-type nuclease